VANSFALAGVKQSLKISYYRLLKSFSFVTNSLFSKRQTSWIKLGSKSFTPYFQRGRFKICLGFDYFHHNQHHPDQNHHNLHYSDQNHHQCDQKSKILHLVVQMQQQ